MCWLEEYDLSRTLLSLLPLAMRFAGPREALCMPSSGGTTELPI
jgi:ATP sulfurylase